MHQAPAEAGARELVGHRNGQDFRLAGHFARKHETTKRFAEKCVRLPRDGTENRALRQQPGKLPVIPGARKAQRMQLRHAGAILMLHRHNLEIGLPA